MLPTANDWYQFAKLLGEAVLWIIVPYFAISVYRAPKICVDFVSQLLTRRRLAKQKNFEQGSDITESQPSP